MRRMIDIRCNGCGAVERDQYVDEAKLGMHGGDGTAPCGGQWQKVTLDMPVTSRSAVVHGDDIPGGVLMYNGVCNDDGSPRRFYSKSEIARAAKEKGLHNHVEHIPEKGSDKSKHTTRWV